jgi:hypothetical protein
VRAWLRHPSAPLSVLALAVALSATAQGGQIRSVLAHPIFKAGYACIEHGADSATWDLGDAFGTDCFVEELIEVDGRSWSRPYQGNGYENQDWYGWRQEVLSPCTCTVVSVSLNRERNRPGVMGAQAASLLILQRADKVIFHLAHIERPLVKPGDAIVDGQLIAQVGNNGLSRHPHIHIGTYQGAEPLQIRFDQRFIQPLKSASH